jgi:hypothetical protein
MENQTRFDLNAAIQNWQQELAAQSNLTPDVQRELETHLRDSITELRQRGLNDEESFWLARRRVGQPKQLGEEFLKADPAKVWHERAFWIVAFLIVFQIWGAVSTSLFAIFTASSLPNYLPPSINFVLRMLFYVLPVVWVMALVAGGRMTRQFAMISLLFHSQLRLGSAGVLLVIVSRFLQGTATWWQLRTTGPIAMSGTIQIWYFTLSTAIIPLTLVALLVWLMPTRAPVKPKTA